ncbi:MAG: recombinase family protein [Clostridia bacterium]|nr:recombinase family protein [Clostridia bacterium]
MNQYFSEELAQKVSRGLHESRMKGHCIGSVPFGYTKENNKMLTINENERKVLQRIFEDYASGKTILQISRDFEQEGLSNKGKKFIPETIRYILKREIYTGICKINGKEYNNIYPTIISKDLYDKVQKRMALTRYGCRKDNHEIFRIKDKLYCGHCNRKMYPFSTKSHNGNYLRYYKCISGRDNGCLTRITEKNFIEGIVDKFFKQQFTIQKNLDIITDLIYEENKKRTKSNNSLCCLKLDLHRVNTAIANIMTAIEKGIYTETTKSRLEELEKQRKELSEKLVIEESKVSYELTKSDIQNFFKVTMKEYPDKAIDLFLKFVKVYQDKIEIGLNYSINPNDTDYQPIKTYAFTETLEINRTFKGGTKRTKTLTYEVYSVI